MTRKLMIFKAILIILFLSASTFAAQPPGFSKGNKEGWSGSTPPGHSKSGGKKNKYEKIEKIADDLDEDNDMKGKSGKKDKDTELEKATKKTGKKILKEFSK